MLMRIAFLLPLLTLLASFTPIPASAQSPSEPRCSVSQLPECALPNSIRRSLTVIGQGQVTVPADVALLEFQLGVRDAPAADEPGLSLQRAQQITDATLKPTIDALLAVGVDRRNITTQITSLQSPKLFVRLEKPRQEQMQQVVLTVDQALRRDRQLFVQSIGARYSTNRCELVERSARRIALRDAQRQMTTLAEDVGERLGELQSVVVLPIVGPASSVGCGTKVGVSIGASPLAIDEATPPYNPAEKPEVTVRSQVSVTHAIQPAQKQN